MDHIGKLKFRIYVQLPSINKMFQYRYLLIDSVQCRRGYYFRAWVLYFSFGTCLDGNIKLLCFSNMYKPNL